MSEIWQDCATNIAGIFNIQNSRSLYYLVREIAPWNVNILHNNLNKHLRLHCKISLCFECQKHGRDMSETGREDATNIAKIVCHKHERGHVRRDTEVRHQCSSRNMSQTGQENVTVRSMAKVDDTQRVKLCPRLGRSTTTLA